MNQYELIRTELHDRCIGMFKGLDNTVEYVSLELPNLDNEVSVSCIPYGSYVVKPDSTGRWQYFSITNVPNRTFIEIHPAVDISDLEGCIALSSSFSTGYKFNWQQSKQCVEAFKLVQKEPFLLTVRPFSPYHDTWVEYE